MKTAPSFQFYPSDFLVGTALLSNEEKGIYVVLLCYQWAHGRVPGDEKLVSRLASCHPRKLSLVLAKFQKDGEGNYYNERLESERKKQEEYRQRQSLHSHRRWVGITRPYAKPPPDPYPKPHGLAMPASGNALQSSSSTSVNTPIPPRGFEEFWEAYPKKIGKGAAEKAWKRIIKPIETLPLIIEEISRQMASDQWRKDNGQFIPNPATWLNQRRWEDEGLTLPPKPLPELDVPKSKYEEES